jgi:hypothetical protein
MAKFQTVIPTKLGQAEITTKPTTIYTVPGDTRTFVKDINVVNTTLNDIKFNVFLVPVGKLAGPDTAFIYQQLVTISNNIQWVGTQILNAGDTIQVQATAIGLTITVSGGEAA